MPFAACQRPHPAIRVCVNVQNGLPANACDDAAKVEKDGEPMGAGTTTDGATLGGLHRSGIA